MSDALLILYWPDFASHGSASPLSRALVAQSIQRHLCLLYEDFQGYAWDPEGSASPDFGRWGIRLLGSPPDAATLRSLQVRHADAARIVLAMHAARAEELQAGLEWPHPEVDVWTPAGVPGAQPNTAALPDVLHLDTALPVGLFADWDAVEEALARSPAPVDPDDVRDRLVRTAGLVGAVLQAKVASEEEGVVDLAGTATLAQEDETLPQMLSAELQAAEPLHTWILVAQGEWLSQFVPAAHQRGIRVLLWPPDEDAVPAHLLAEADACSPLMQVLDLEGASRPRLPKVGRHRGVHAEVRISSHGTPRTDRLEGTEEPPRPGAAQTLGEGARLGPWLRLMYHVECIQRQNGWTRAPFRKLAMALAEIEEFGPTAANAGMWLNRAKAEGLLLVEHEPPRSNGLSRTAVCRPQADHPVCRAAVEVPDRCLRLLFQMLQKIPWVSFKLLRSVLMREQWLGGPPYRLDEGTIDEWLNFLIHHSAIRMTKEPNLVNPDYPVTALRLNEEHPLSRAVVTEATETTRLAAERAILAVDHFLTRNRKPWMAMGALRRALDGMGRDELQAVLQGLQNLGALITESYPNPQKEHFTTGCRLKLDEPIVARALQVRNLIIETTQRHGQDRSWVALTRVSETLAQHSEASTASQQLAWFLLLRDEGILELDQEMVALPWGDVRCRLNVSDAVVRSVIADRLDGGYGSSDYD